MGKNRVYPLLLFLLSYSSQAAAFQWFSDWSYRVESMGGVEFLVPYEPSGLDLYNHGNLAGLVFTAPQSRLDLGIGYYGRNYLTETGLYSSSSHYSEYQLGMPAGSYQGATVWLSEHAVMQIKTGGKIVNYSYKEKFGNVVTIDKNLCYSFFNSSISLALRTDSGLAFGLETGYHSFGGGPKVLEGEYDYYGWMGLDTDKYDIRGKSILWSAGFAYLKKHEKTGNEFMAGAQVRTGTQDPSIYFYSSTWLIPMFLGDFQTIEIVKGAPVPDNGRVEDVQTNRQFPITTSGELGFSLAGIFKTGVLLDYRISEYKLSAGSSGYPVPPDEYEYTQAKWDQLGVTPMLQMYIPTQGDTRILLTGLYTTSGHIPLPWQELGSGTITYYDLNTSTSARNDTYKSGVASINLQTWLFALGAYAPKSFLIGVQFAPRSSKLETVSYNEGGGIDSSSPMEGYGYDLRAGFEAWLSGAVALRGGYALLCDAVKDGALSTGGSVVDMQYFWHRLSAGLGVNVNEQFQLHFLGKYEMFQEEPDPIPPKQSDAMGFYLQIEVFM